MENVVKWFNDEKGYGYIIYKGNNILVHYCGFRELDHNTPGKYEIVEFELVNTGAGYKIKNIVQTEEVA